MKIIKIIGLNIRRYRQEKSWTIEQLAEKCELSSSYMGLLERGKRETSLSSLEKLANVLSVSPETLLFTSKIKASPFRDKLLNEIQMKAQGLSSKQLRAAANIMDEIGIL